MRRIALVCIFAAAPAAAQQIYDLLIKNGHVIDSANHRDGRFDIAVIGNKVARVTTDLPAAHARVVVDASRYYVTPGLVDIHTHFDNLNPDHNCLRNGVTTAVDSGTGWKTFDRSRVRLFAFVPPEEAASDASKYPQVVVGIRAPDAAFQASDGTIVLADSSSEALLKRLRPGDILSNCYGLKMQPSMWEARKRGVLFDAGHGFWFRIAAPAIRQGLLPDIISTGMDRESIMLPRATMTNVMSKLLNLGMTVEQVIERSTVNPAKAIRRPELGALSEGAVADIALIEEQKGQFGFLDSGHGKLIGDRRLRCVLTVRNGQVVWDDDGLSLTDWQKAGPYSNFR